MHTRAGEKKNIHSNRFVVVFKLLHEESFFRKNVPLRSTLCFPEGEKSEEKCFVTFLVLLALRSRCSAAAASTRLSGLEKELKKTLEEKSVALETAERRLVDITEALRSQKQLRMKEMHENQVERDDKYLVQHLGQQACLSLAAHTKYFPSALASGRL